MGPSRGRALAAGDHRRRRCQRRQRARRLPLMLQVQRPPHSFCASLRPDLIRSLCVRLTLDLLFSAWIPHSCAVYSNICSMCIWLWLTEFWRSLVQPGNGEGYPEPQDSGRHRQAHRAGSLVQCFHRREPREAFGLLHIPGIRAPRRRAS
jgi:hypothetical protein